MFVGHYAVGFAAKRFAPQTSLGVLIAAALLLDLLWPLLVLAGWEQVQIDPGNTAFTPLNFVSYPISHSLLATLGWATLFAAIYYFVTSYRSGAIVAWVGVVSHWVLDFVTHRPDLPLYPGGPLAGLGLWNSPFATIAVEGLMYVVGVWIYLRVTRQRDRIGSWAIRVYIITIALFYIANIFSPPPTEVRPILVATTPIVWLMILWAWWADRHREAR
jgi:hypothetical protein